MIKWTLLAAIVVGTIWYWKPVSEFLAQDSCLDDGGVWRDSKCIGARHSKTGE
jgi:hypothetical protein